MKNKKMKGMLAAVAAILSLHMGTLYAAEGVQIGRASCRERV